MRAVIAISAGEWRRLVGRVEALEVKHAGVRIRACVKCGKSMKTGFGTGYRSTRKFCSSRCKVAWHRGLK